MEIKNLHVQVLDDVKTKGNLSEQQAEWLVEEHIKNESMVTELFDAEISKQRMKLDERVATRKALAEKAVSILNDDILQK